MKHDKKTLFLSAAAIAVLGSHALAQEVTMRVGDVYQPNHTISRGADELARLVEEKSNGEIDVQVFYAEELGSEREMAEMTHQGGLEMVLSGPPGTGAYVPQLDAGEVFYTYADADDLVRVFETILPELNAFAEPQNFHIVGVFYAGPRTVLSKTPINNVSDFEGVRMRVPQSPLYVALPQAWGATPTSIALSEAYTALESGVVDAIEGTSENLVTMGFIEPAKYLTRTEHGWAPQPMAVNFDWWQSLSDEHRAIIEESAKGAAAFQLELLIEATVVAEETMREEGVEFIEPEDIAQFRDPVQEAMDVYMRDKNDEAGYELYQHMREIADNDTD